MALIRISIFPVTDEEWDIMMQMAAANNCKRFTPNSYHPKHIAFHLTLFAGYLFYANSINTSQHLNLLDMKMKLTLLMMQVLLFSCNWKIIK
jgi:hypothetical protein